jgi:hypothetical protein
MPSVNWIRFALTLDASMKQHVGFSGEQKAAG